MSNDYRIEELGKIFAEHAKEYLEISRKVDEQWLEHNPGQELPECMKDRFNLSEALFVITDEIIKLKNILDKNI